MINADNGPENNGARTQWLRRLAQLSVEHQINVILACYPPYHSKYNPVERVFGVLENYWNGDPLLTTGHALGMAAAMTYKGVHPVTSLHAGCAKGVRLPPRQMRILEQAVERKDGVRKWFLTIQPEAAAKALALLN